VHPLAVQHLHPEQVIVIGRPTLHRSINQLLKRHDLPIFALSRTPDWADVAATVQEVGSDIRVVGQQNPIWESRCQRLSQLATQTVRHVLEQVQQREREITGLHVAVAVTDALRSTDQLLLGASNPVRDAALALDVQDSFQKRAVRVYSNRGVAGIDGTVSTAMGISLATERSQRGIRTIALLGDLTFLHDASGLLVPGPTGKEEPRPEQLIIIVANDQGGGIFSLLEQGHPDFQPATERIFGTRHHVDIAALCQAYGANYLQVKLPELVAILTENYHNTSYQNVGVTVLELKTNRAALRHVHQEIHATVERAIHQIQLRES
jgi:2-succinyl-5-enolpyruvyl-6-hydroxy-3-cyclohexene-1-carboxylate synthase